MQKCLFSKTSLGLESLHDINRKVIRDVERSLHKKKLSKPVIKKIYILNSSIDDTLFF